MSIYRKVYLVANYPSTHAVGIAFMPITLLCIFEVRVYTLVSYYATSVPELIGNCFYNSRQCRSKETIQDLPAVPSHVKTTRDMQSMPFILSLSEGEERANIGNITQCHFAIYFMIFLL